MLAFIICFIIIVCILLYITSKGEGDLTLLYYECFGKPLSVLNGQVIWITGASSGIGEHLAYVLAENKAQLVLSGRNEKELERVKGNCLELSKALNDYDILVLPFDIGDYAVHESSFQKVLSHFKTLDILVNNAGRSQRSNFQDIEVEVHEQLFRTNTFGPVNLTKTVLPYFLEEKKGHVVVTSSTAGIMGVPLSASYTGSKHALHGFFECLRIEMAFEPFYITMVCPGPIESNVVQNACTGKMGGSYECPPDIGNQRKVVKASRCAELMACAMANKMDHVWISNQPVLLCHYLHQYCPSFFRNVLLKKAFTKERMAEMRDGR